MTDPIRAAAERLLQELKLPSGTPYAGLLLEQAENDLRAALAAHLAVGSHCPAGAKLSPEQCRRVAALLREARPQPVPVAERPWEQPGWCDAEGRCWWLTLDQSWPCLYLMKPNSALATDSATYSLPHWFIRIPTESTTETPQ